jgi:uncharacterized protein YdeI (YjbR/CyaY-like superfamily)
MSGRVRFFRSAPAWRAWLDDHHAKIDELWVGFHRKDSGRGGLTYTEAVDEALCYGWIDGVRRKVDASSYTNRFTPRRPRSRWSAVNIRRATILRSRGLMAPAGLAAFTRRALPDPVTVDRPAALPPELAERFTRAEKAWRFFIGQPAGYQRLALLWVMSARRPETRERRLATVMADAERGLRIASLRKAVPTPGARRSD